MFVLKQNGMKERQLYDYQLDMKRRVGEAFGSHRSVMVQMPTGTGKTCLLVACVRAWLSQNEGTVWIVVHRRELVEQIVGTLQEENFRAIWTIGCGCTPSSGCLGTRGDWRRGRACW